MIRQAVSTDRAPQAIGPHSQAIVGFGFPSGTAGIDPATDVAPDAIEERAEQALRNLDEILTAAGASLTTLAALATLVKTNIFYANVDDFARTNAMPDPPPARAAPGNVTLPRNCSSPSTRSP